MKYSISFITLTLLLWSSSSYAEEGILDANQDIELSTTFSFNFHQHHDRGVYTRLGAGVGYVTASITPPYQGEEVNETGARFGYNAVLGGFVRPQFAVHLSHWGQLGAHRGSLGAGVGQTFYLKEDQNVFLSTSLGAVTLYDDAPDVTFARQFALGGEVEAGLGTWVSLDSSLGASLVAGGHLLDLDRDAVMGSGWHAGVRVTWAFH